MKKNLRTLLISGGIFIVAAAFTIFCGFTVSRLSAPRGGEKESTAETELPESTEEAESRTEEQTSSETEPEPTETEVLFSDGVIHELSGTRLQGIASTYSGEVMNYPLDSQRDNKNRPEQNVRLLQEFSDRFGEGKVKIFGNTEVNAAYFSFVLTTEVDMNTSVLLDTLKEKDVKALFFVSHSYVEANPEVVKRIVEEGHELGSIGSQQDCPISELSLEQQSADVIALQQEVTELTGIRMTKFFFSFNAYSNQTLAMLTEMGYTVCFYSANYSDLDKNAVINSDEFLTDMKERLHQGIVYSLHTTNTATLVMVPQLIDYLRSVSFTPELL